MYNYDEPSMFSGKKGFILLLVIGLHIIVGYGFYSGLARRIVQTIIPPVEVSEIDKPKPDDKPPPPPPKLEEIKPLRAAARIRRHLGAGVGERDHPDHNEQTFRAGRRRRRRPGTPHERQQDLKHPLKIGEDIIRTRPSEPARKAGASSR